MYISMILGGKERGLNFKMGTLRHIGELTQSDPLDFSVSSDISKQYGFVKTIVHAGLLANADAKGVEPDFTERDVVRWVDDMDLNDVTKVTTAFTKAFSVAGEGGSDTQG